VPVRITRLRCTPTWRSIWADSRYLPEITRLFVNIANPAAWELIVNKQTGQGGLDYDSKQDLGKVKMTMTKPRLPSNSLTLRWHLPVGIRGS
jgi:hypothetical protein